METYETLEPFEFRDGVRQAWVMRRIGDAEKRCIGVREAFECKRCGHDDTESRTDGIATGLSRALVALEARAKELALRDDLRAGETASCAKLVRGLLEALVDAPTDPGGKLAQR